MRRCRRALAQALDAAPPWRPRSGQQLGRTGDCAPCVACTWAPTAGILWPSTRTMSSRSAKSLAWRRTEWRSYARGHRADLRRPCTSRTPAGAANVRALASPPAAPPCAFRRPEHPGGHQAASPCQRTAGTHGTGPGCPPSMPPRVREASPGGDCRLQRRLTTPAACASPRTGCFSAVVRRRTCRAAAQERYPSVLHGSPVFLNTVC